MSASLYDDKLIEPDDKMLSHGLALYFKNKACKNALYLDGFISRTYLPSANWMQLDGNFGVIIAQKKQTNPAANDF